MGSQTWLRRGQGGTGRRAAKDGCDGDAGRRRNRRLRRRGGDWLFFGVNVKKYWGGYDKKKRNYLEIG